MLLIGVDHDDKTWGLPHGANSTEIALELHLVFREIGDLFFSEPISARFEALFDALEFANRLANRREVGQHPPKPTLANEKFSASLGAFANDAFGLFFGADE